ncbi:hypothetical protein H696_00694 [Fonticula alba]|uniref:Uncharacterized protein n=1 Tax=Fonticula alba TaxID=691883 RepID=A0A058ZGT5_FONAL|nr:hypothetical protein H696_00694 [Fonticula alba]KCV73148.1 hypothetical protein H696_00694 [Fonticula alba]|eukprot:XP_009492849.1 hypothetical protein H696_00694 [Fonticula alba]
MGAMTFVGCLLTAYSAPAYLTWRHILPQSLRVILMMTGMFIYLLGVFLASLFWFAVVPLRQNLWFSIPFSVGFQFLARYAYYRLYMRIGNGINAISDNPANKWNGLDYAFVGGHGFGLMSALVMNAAALAESLGPAFVPCASCPSLSSFFVYAILALYFWYIHILMMPLCMNAFSRQPPRRAIFRVATLYLTQTGASYATNLFHNAPGLVAGVGNGGPCSIAFLVMIAIAVGLSFEAWRVLDRATMR